MWPWDWLSAAGNALSGLTQKAVDWVNSLIASVMSWVTDAINAIWKSIQGVWDDVTHVWNTLVGVINRIVVDVWNGIYNLSTSIGRWVLGLVNDLWKYANWLFSWTLQQLDLLTKLAWEWVSDVYTWVRNEIWDPLVRLYNDVKAWAVQMFNQVWQYIEHPELLVNLIGAFLLKVWLEYAAKYGVMLARWLVKNMMGAAGEVFDLLETVISSII